MKLRAATSKDYDALGQVMFRAIHEGESPYTKAQRLAWLPKANSGAAWSDRLSQQYVVLAERGNDILGFMSVFPYGYIDLAFILASARGQGVFGQLLRGVTDHATQQGLLRLTTHASLSARPAFSRYGFETVRHEIVERAGDRLQRAEMVKRL